MSEPWIIHEYIRPRLGEGCVRCGRLPDNLQFHYPPLNTPSKDVNKILEVQHDDEHIVRGDA